MDYREMLTALLSIGLLGLAFGMLLAYSAKKFAVEVDERVPKVREVLPSANCGGCGYAGCDAYAAAVVEGAAPPNRCTVGGAAVALKVAEILGVEVDTAEPKKAYVKCAGTCSKAKQKSDYYGVEDCRQAALVTNGSGKSCDYGCMGLGSCKKVCQFGAIKIEEGIAVVDAEKCTGCGACVKACPKVLIELKPLSATIRVACSSKNKLKEVKDACAVGCITCGICVKSCPHGALTMVDNIPVCDKEKCTLCMVCVQKCPTKAIIAYGKKDKIEEDVV